MLAPGLLPLAANVRETVTIQDHRPLAALPREAKLAWLKQRDFDWVWNTEGEESSWHSVLAHSGNPNWFTTPTQKRWLGRHVLRVRFRQLRVRFPELRGYPEPALTLTPFQEGVCRSFRSAFPPGQTLVAIQPGAGAPERVWPPEKFRDLISALVADSQVTVLLFLSDAESEFATPGYLPARDALRFVSKPLEHSLPELAACDLFIGNDSGFYHLAFALGLKVVGIYRSFGAAHTWAYRSPRSRAVFVYLPGSLRRHWKRWLSVRRVLRAAAALVPGLRSRL